MRFINRRYTGEPPEHEEDPLAGIANLFDVSVAFIVALLIALFTMFSAVEFLDPNSSVTLVKQNQDGTMEIISKEKEEIKVQKVSDKTLSGQGTRLGVAYSSLMDRWFTYLREKRRRVLDTLIQGPSRSAAIGSFRLSHRMTK